MRYNGRGEIAVKENLLIGIGMENFHLAVLKLMDGPVSDKLPGQGRLVIFFKMVIKSSFFYEI